MTGHIALHILRAGIELPRASTPIANYVPVVLTKDQAVVSGQITSWNGEFKYVGQLGTNFSVTEGQAAARICGLNIIAQLQTALGDLDRIARCVKLNIFVNSGPAFTDQSTVANGVSDLMVEIFGDVENTPEPRLGFHNCRAELLLRLTRFLRSRIKSFASN